MTGSSLIGLLMLIDLRYTDRNQIQAAMPRMPAQINRTRSSAVSILPAVFPGFFPIRPPFTESLQFKDAAQTLLLFIRSLFSSFSYKVSGMPQRPLRASEHAAELPTYRRSWGLLPTRITDLPSSP